MSDNTSPKTVAKNSNNNLWAGIQSNVQEIAKDRNTWIGLGTGIGLTLLGVKIYQVVTSDNKKK